MVVHKNIISFGFHAKDASGEELDAQLKLFMEIARISGYKITKKLIIHHNGYGIVDVEGSKEV